MSYYMTHPIVPSILPTRFPLTSVSAEVGLFILLLLATVGLSVLIGWILNKVMQGKGFKCSMPIDYYFRTALSKDTINVSTVWVPFDEITVREKHYKEYRVGTNGMTRNDVLAYSAPEKVIYCGDYFSTSAKTFTGWTLNSEYVSGFSGYWSMSWIGDYKNINSLNDCCEWDIVDKTWESKDAPRWTKYM